MQSSKRTSFEPVNTDPTPHDTKRKRSDSFTPPDENTIVLGKVLECPSVEKHKEGYFCITCRGIAGEWGSILPVMKSERDGKVITIGPTGAIVEGVQLHNEEAIAVLSTVVFLLVKGYLYSHIPGFISIMDRHPKSVAAGELIAEIYQVIQKSARNEAEDAVPNFGRTVELALIDPELKPHDLISKVLSGFVAYKDPEEDKDKIPEFLSESGLDSQSEAMQKPKAKKYGPEGEWDTRRFRTLNESHKPPNGNWKLADGTDMTPAVLGQPDPGKFFILRQDQDDVRRFDIREYPHIWKFDWNDKIHIDSLNKNRQQIFKRTDPSVIDSKPTWTKKEKETLEELIRADLLLGKNKTTLDWDDIRDRLSKKFENVLQEKGVPLAQTNKNIKGEWILPKKTDPKLAHDRLGPATRSASAIRSQASNFRDILELINSYPGKIIADEESQAGAADGCITVTGWKDYDIDFYEAQAKSSPKKKAIRKRRKTSDDKTNKMSKSSSVLDEESRDFDETSTVTSSVDNANAKEFDSNGEKNPEDGATLRER
ncbi:uncharacterized protein LY89DRAFT_751495 [Mollisia scopiformis]|uniref:Uncharacterized protein n=1 Tax=Mollisia scopiformis TaxID=149040 RepID=A0A194X486_MOLSC|nr:uncharacterized protein LY89DRAFT_751495 [Mollisia scopiformis]KUJ14869.1 hypothetical protein LY89DRAFT_751495 [Mollisia scopiformis]